MNTANLVLSPGGVHDEKGWSRLDWNITGLTNGRFTLSHTLPETNKSIIGDTERGDHAIVAILFRAMYEGRDIVVEGKVSPTLLDGVETLQEIWHRWRPARYKLMRVRAEEESEATTSSSDRPAIFAFSGGVDASFSIFRHLQGQAGRNNHRPGAALLVHGMDIPLDRPDVYASAARRAESMLAGTGIELIRMRTNSRRLKQPWGDSFGLQLASSFLLTQETYAHAVLGSGEPYDTLVLPWGSTPLTDRLASTDAMQIVLDGGAFDRTEKIAWLYQNTDVMDRLRVCWAGEELDRNCGECEKCVRTMLNFWAIGREPPPGTFPSRLTPARVRSVQATNLVQLKELKSLFRHAASTTSSDDPIYRAMRSVFLRSAVHRALNSASYYGRRILRRE